MVLLRFHCSMQSYAIISTKYKLSSHLTNFFGHQKIYKREEELNVTRIIHQETWSNTKKFIFLQVIFYTSINLQTNLADGSKYFQEFLNSQNISFFFHLHSINPNYPYFKANTVIYLSFVRYYLRYILSFSLLYITNVIGSQIH